MNFKLYYLTYTDRCCLKKKIGNIAYTMLTSDDCAEMEALYKKILEGKFDTEDEIFEAFAKKHYGESLINYYRFAKHEK